MPRRKRLRRVVAPPGFKGYKPYGSSQHRKQHVELLYEEYEAIKLADYDLLNHLEASKLMGVSSQLSPGSMKVPEGNWQMHLWKQGKSDQSMEMPYLMEPGIYVMIAMRGLQSLSK